MPTAHRKPPNSIVIGLAVLLLLGSTLLVAYLGSRMFLVEPVFYATDNGMEMRAVPTYPCAWMESLYAPADWVAFRLRPDYWDPPHR